MPSPIPPFPTLNLRLQSPDPLTWEEGDENWTAVRAYILAVVAYVQGALNSDGTLIQGSVGSAALQAASVTLAALNPSLLYSIVPVDDDSGTVTNQYVITARGGAGTGNIVPGGATYDPNGNYVLSGLTENYGYFWNPGANDASVQSTPPLTAAGSFTANEASILLTGTAGDAVTANVSQSAPVNQYKNGQIFFVWTTRANTGPSTLNVNNLGAIPIQYYGQQLQTGQIGAPGVFAVVYKNGVFSIFVGAIPPSGSGTGGTTVVTTMGFNGITQNTLPNVALATGAFPNAIMQSAHGLGGVPTSFAVVLVCLTADSGFNAGQEVPLGAFTNNGNGPAFSASFDAINFYVTQFSAASVVNPTTGGLVAITPANWALSVSGSIASNYSGTVVFPATTWEFANVNGAFCYDTTMMTFATDSFGNAGKAYINQVNLLNNEITPVIQTATGQLYVNGAVFSPSFFGGSGTAQFVYTCNTGLYQISALNPGTNVITPDSAYSAGGTATVALSFATAYVWTPASNDVSITVDGITYLASNAVNGQITFTTTAGGGTDNATMNGSPSTVIQSTIVTSATSWSPSLISTKLSNPNWYKPVWVANNGNTVYVVNSESTSGSVKSLSCYQVTSTTALLNGAWAANNSAALNLTNSNIVNVAAFNAWYPTTSTAPVTLFQYNPVSKRIYVMTPEMNAVHIFQLTTASNDFSAWWNTASPAREQALKYVKSIMSGSGGVNSSTQGNCHRTVDYDPSSGKERALCYTRDNPGSIMRIPWTE